MNLVNQHSYKVGIELNRIGLQGCEDGWLTNAE
jgi:hypothetical protein